MYTALLIGNDGEVANIRLTKEELVREINSGAYKVIAFTKGYRTARWTPETGIVRMP